MVFGAIECPPPRFVVIGVISYRKIGISCYISGAQFSLRNRFNRGSLPRRLIKARKEIQIWRLKGSSARMQWHLPSKWCIVYASVAFSQEGKNAPSLRVLVYIGYLGWWVAPRGGNQFASKRARYSNHIRAADTSIWQLNLASGVPTFLFHCLLLVSVLREYWGYDQRWYAGYSVGNLT